MVARKKLTVYKVRGVDCEVHIGTGGCVFDPFETFCGELENENSCNRERTDDPIDCAVCKVTYEALKDGVKIGVADE